MADMPDWLNEELGSNKLTDKEWMSVVGWMRGERRLLVGAYRKMRKAGLLTSPKTRRQLSDQQRAAEATWTDANPTGRSGADVRSQLENELDMTPAEKPAAVPQLKSSPRVNETGLPPVAEGFTRLYRGDVIDPDTGQPYEMTMKVGGRGDTQHRGNWWSTSPSKPRAFATSEGMPVVPEGKQSFARYRYVDLPSDEVEQYLSINVDPELRRRYEEEGAEQYADEYLVPPDRTADAKELDLVVNEQPLNRAINDIIMSPSAYGFFQALYSNLDDIVGGRSIMTDASTMGYKTDDVRADLMAALELVENPEGNFEQLRSILQKPYFARHIAESTGIGDKVFDYAPKAAPAFTPDAPAETASTEISAEPAISSSFNRSRRIINSKYFADLMANLDEDGNPKFIGEQFVRILSDEFGVAGDEVKAIARAQFLEKNGTAVAETPAPAFTPDTPSAAEYAARIAGLVALVNSGELDSVDAMDREIKIKAEAKKAGVDENAIDALLDDPEFDPTTVLATAPKTQTFTPDAAEQTFTPDAPFTEEEINAAFTPDEPTENVMGQFTIPQESLEEMDKPVYNPIAYDVRGLSAAQLTMVKALATGSDTKYNKNTHNALIKKGFVDEQGRLTERGVEAVRMLPDVEITGKAILAPDATTEKLEQNREQRRAARELQKEARMADEEDAATDTPPAFTPDQPRPLTNESLREIVDLYRRKQIVASTAGEVGGVLGEEGGVPATEGVLPDAKTIAAYAKKNNMSKVEAELALLANLPGVELKPSDEAVTAYAIRYNVTADQAEAALKKKMGQALDQLGEQAVLPEQSPIPVGRIDDTPRYDSPLWVESALGNVAGPGADRPDELGSGAGAGRRRLTGKVDAEDLLRGSMAGTVASGAEFVGGGSMAGRYGPKQETGPKLPVDENGNLVGQKVGQYLRDMEKQLSLGRMTLAEYDIAMKNIRQMERVANSRKERKSVDRLITPEEAEQRLADLGYSYPANTLEGRILRFSREEIEAFVPEARRLIASGKADAGLLSVIDEALALRLADERETIDFLWSRGMLGEQEYEDRIAALVVPSVTGQGVVTPQFNTGDNLQQNYIRRRTPEQQAEAAGGATLTPGLERSLLADIPPGYPQRPVSATTVSASGAPYIGGVAPRGTPPISVGSGPNRIPATLEQLEVQPTPIRAGLIESGQASLYPRVPTPIIRPEITPQVAVPGSAVGPGGVIYPPMEDNQSPAPLQVVEQPERRGYPLPIAQVGTMGAALAANAFDRFRAEPVVPMGAEGSPLSYRPPLQNGQSVPGSFPRQPAPAPAPPSARVGGLVSPAATLGASLVGATRDEIPSMPKAQNPTRMLDGNPLISSLQPDPRVATSAPPSTVTATPQAATSTGAPPASGGEPPVIRRIVPTSPFAPTETTLGSRASRQVLSDVDAANQAAQDRLRDIRLNLEASDDVGEAVRQGARNRISDLASRLGTPPSPGTPPPPGTPFDYADELASFEDRMAQINSRIGGPGGGGGGVPPTLAQRARGFGRGLMTPASIGVGLAGFGAGLAAEKLDTPYTPDVEGVDTADIGQGLRSVAPVLSFGGPLAAGAIGAGLVSGPIGWGILGAAALGSAIWGATRGKKTPTEKLSSAGKALGLSDEQIGRYTSQVEAMREYGVDDEMMATAQQGLFEQMMSEAEQPGGSSGLNLTPEQELAFQKQYAESLAAINAESEQSIDEAYRVMGLDPYAVISPQDPNAMYARSLQGLRASKRNLGSAMAQQALYTPIEDVIAAREARRLQALGLDQTTGYGTATQDQLNQLLGRQALATG